MSAEPPQRQSDEQKSALIERILSRKVSAAEVCRRYGLARSDLEEWVRIYRRHAHRAIDERLRSELGRLGLDVGHLGAAEFSGQVADIALGELIQTIQFGRRDASIRIEHDAEVGFLWCVDGEIVDAEASHLKGVAAVYRLLALEHGRVYANYSPVQRVRNVKVSTQGLLMEAARRVDESRQLRNRLGDTSAIYVPSNFALAPNVTATPAQFGVLRLFDGMRSIEEVVRVSHSPDLETLGHISRLLDGGLLELSPELPEAPLRETGAHALSFLPFAATLGVPPSLSRQRLFAAVVAVVGGATLFAVLVLRPSSAEKAVSFGAESALADGRESTARLPARPAPESRCPESAARVGGSPRVPAFCLDRREVTVEAYAVCAGAGACSATGKTRVGTAPIAPELRERADRAFNGLCNAGRIAHAQHPINCVAQPAAARYCAFRGGRLPTEEEWQLGLGGAEKRPFPWGVAAPDATRLNACGTECRAWYSASGIETLFEGLMYEADDGRATTAPVGAYVRGASPEGILDLLGNVAEWTSTRVEFFDADGERGQPAPDSFVVRGGSFASGADALAPPRFRLYLGAERVSESIGFRCAY